MLIVIVQVICFVVGVWLVSVNNKNVLAWLIITLNGIMIPMNLITLIKTK